MPFCARTSANGYLALCGNRMRIELANLENGRGEIVHLYQPAELQLTDERVQVSSPVTVKGTLRRASGALQIDGRITGQLEVECDRCLKAVIIPLDTNFSVEYISDDDYHETKAVELTDKDMALSVFDGVGIDVDELVREQILLAVPARSLCDEGCKGMCPTCGVNLNQQTCNCESQEIDPRWNELKKLKTS